MRGLLVLLLLLAPSVLAQTASPVPLVELQGEDPPMVPPLQGAVTANLTTRVSCTLVGEGGRVGITYTVEAMPAWSQVVVSPASDVVDVTACEGGTATRHATVSVTAGDQAPAFRPTPLRIQATATGVGGRNESATATLNVTADYFSILDAVARDATKTARPGAEVEFPITLANLGNGRTRVTFVVENASDDLVIETPDALTLGSKQQGEAANSAETRVVARTKEGGMLVNRVGTFTLLLKGEHADAPPRAGDEARLTFVVTTRSDAPGPGLALVALAVVAAAYAARRD